MTTEPTTTSATSVSPGTTTLTTHQTTTSATRDPAVLTTVGRDPEISTTSQDTRTGIVSRAFIQVKMSSVEGLSDDIILQVVQQFLNKQLNGTTVTASVTKVERVAAVSR
ncbi:uncharacterized protein isoform X2 [Takifugu rubripes]|nr:uncharacterized protein LOC105418816 isoform X2 [Takifugu rubripes]